MILSAIKCEWPQCKATSAETHEGVGFQGWGHIRGFKIDGEQRDFHLCPKHLLSVGDMITKEKEKTNGMD
jgi:hypothetical protein